MTRNQIIKIAMVVCAVVLLCAVILNFTGVFGSSGIGGYADAEKYTAGGTEITGEVKNLYVNWTSGKVAVAYHAGNTVKLEEKADRALSEDEQLRWWLDGDTLRVQFSKPGIRLNMPGKALTVTLPEGIALDSAELFATSGDLEIPTVKAKTLKLVSTSGDISAAAEAETADAGSTSGDIKLRMAGRTESVSAGSTSGSISVEAEKAGNIRAGSTSGGISIAAEEAGTVTAGSTSGGIYVSLRKTEKAEISSTSGSVTAALPEEPGFTAKVHTVSGSVSCDLEARRDGDRYIRGDGSVSVSIGTTSGNVRIQAAGKPEEEK